MDLEISEGLVDTRPQETPTLTTVDLDGLLHASPLTIQQNATEGCGGRIWPAGIVLGKYMLRKIELGAGGGLTGLAVAKGCKLTNPLYITDQAVMLELMQENIRLNGLEDRVIPHVLNWGEEALPETLPSKPDIVLAADCVYFEPSFPLLLETLTSLVGPHSTVFFCFKKRRRADLRFMKMARKVFVVEEIEDDPDREIYRKENIYLCTMKRR
ncbi:MAG: hypothetical protein M1823_001299 [Watsoniomyces obsoletus]|nr:MAG: hypothetical protein M1823_001299 [Watsoniomyces obsoletus]